MKKVLLGSAIALLGFSVMSGVAYAAPPEKVEAYVEPMVGGHAGEKGQSDNFIQIDSSYFNTNPSGHTIIVPKHATNMDGAGSPNGPRAEQGEPGYSPIWANDGGSSTAGPLF